MRAFFLVHRLMNGFSLLLTWPVKYICYQANMHVDCSTHLLLVKVLFIDYFVDLFQDSRTLCDLTKKCLFLFFVFLN